jgi:hypothetical protein
MKRLYGAITVCVLTWCSCHHDSGGRGDASPSDVYLPFLVPEVPPGCPPGMANELGIGGPCTRNGGECKNGLSCLCDDRLGFAMPAGMPCFCTNPTLGTCSSTNLKCGSNATCCEFPVTPSTLVSGCFPSVCLYSNQCPIITWPTDAGPAAVPDAGPDAAADVMPDVSADARPDVIGIRS